MKANPNTEYRTLNTSSCDVLVVGGGVAGVPAAVAAARAGANTLLVEKRPFPGGTGVVALHRTLCGLYSTGGAGGQASGATLVNGGLVGEICERLAALAPDSRPIRLGKVDVLPYLPDHLRTIYSDLLQAEKCLRVRFETEIHDARLKDDRIESVMAGAEKIFADRVVDCSGDGVVICSHPALHEAPPVAGRQLAGLVLQFTGVSGSDDMLPIKVPYAIRQGTESGALPASLRFTTFSPGDKRDEGGCKLSFPSGTTDRQARETAMRLYEYLRETLPAFRNARIVNSSPEVLEREGARLKGLYTLTEEDVLASRRFPDAVARSAWPIELWDPQRGPIYRYPEPGTACDIPLRCLKAGAVVNLFCAGRCISATHEALAATRVMGTCMALGEAAGREAAGCRI